MPFNKNRNSRDDKSRKDKQHAGKSNSFKSSSDNSDNRSFSKGRGKEDWRTKDGAKSPDGKKDRTFSSRPYGSKDSGNGGGDDKKPYGTRQDGPSTERKSYGKRSDGFSDKKSYTDKNTFADRKAYGDRKTGRDEPSKFGERRNFKDQPQERKPFVSSDRDFGGDKKPFRKKYEGDNDSQVRLKSKIDSPKNYHKGGDEFIRLNRYISNAGICSRRKADELIAAGTVSVNGEVVTELGTKINPSKDQVKYNGELLKREKMIYVLLNKPKDYITTTDDPQERKTVMQLVDKASKERIYPVGRLDRNTTGLLLLTNDGDLADKLSHPKNSISKIYHVELNRNLTQGDFNKIAFGLELEDGFIKPDDLRYVTGGAKNEIGIQIHSGKNRIVRRIFESLGYEVVKLDRVIYANLTKKDLTRGRWRYLTEQEIIQLKHFTKN